MSDLKPGTYPLEDVKTAWESLPEAIRIAAWIWAFATMVGTVCGFVLAMAWLVGAA